MYLKFGLLAEKHNNFVSFKEKELGTSSSSLSAFYQKEDLLLIFSDIFKNVAGIWSVGLWSFNAGMR